MSLPYSLPVATTTQLEECEPLHLFLQVQHEINMVLVNDTENTSMSPESLAWLSEYKSLLISWGVDARAQDGSLAHIRGKLKDHVGTVLKRIRNKIRTTCGEDTEEIANITADGTHSRGQARFQRVLDDNTQEYLNEYLMVLRRSVRSIHMDFAYHSGTGPWAAMQQRIDRISCGKLGKDKEHEGKTLGFEEEQTQLRPVLASASASASLPPVRLGDISAEGPDLEYLQQELNPELTPALSAPAEGGVAETPGLKQELKDEQSVNATEYSKSAG